MECRLYSRNLAKKIWAFAVGCEKAGPSAKRFFIWGLPGGADGLVRLWGAGMARGATEGP